MKARLSVSMIKDFLSCNRKAYYRIYAPEQQEQTWQMAVGTIVHDTLEKYWNDYDRAIEYADNLVKTTNLKRGMPIVYKSLGNFFDKFTYLCNEDDSVEKFFNIPYNGLELVGKFDRISKEGVVIDWKTGASVPLDIGYDLQFILYEYAYTKLYGIPPERMFLVSLPSGKIVPYERNDAMVEEFLNVTLPFVAESLTYNLDNNIFVRTGIFGYGMCKNCAFSNICYKEIGA